MLLSVFVMAAQCREPEHGGFVLHHEVDDVLDSALGLLEIQFATVMNRLCEMVGCCRSGAVGCSGSSFATCFWVAPCFGPLR